MRETKNMTFDEIDAIISNLDLFSRILMGQYDEIIWKVTGKMFFGYDNRELSSLLRQIRDQLIPSIQGWDLNGSLGIWGPTTPMIAQKAYDIQQCLRYQMAYHRHPEGGITVNFRPPYIHGRWKVVQLDEYHEILRRQHCGVYQPGYAIRNPWTCPAILDHFDSEKVDLIMDDPDVKKIINLAGKWSEYVKNNDLISLFTDVQNYTNGKMSAKQLEKVCKQIIDKINEM